MCWCSDWLLQWLIPPGLRLKCNFSQIAIKFWVWCLSSAWVLIQSEEESYTFNCISCFHYCKILTISTKITHRQKMYLFGNNARIVLIYKANTEFVALGAWNIFWFQLSKIIYLCLWGYLAFMFPVFNVECSLSLIAFCLLSTFKKRMANILNDSVFN